jgi:hypothetical protein
MLITAAGIAEVGDVFANWNLDAADNSHRLTIFGMEILFN